MPELPEVETVRAGLENYIGHERILQNIRLTRQDLRFPFPKDFAKRLTGRRITEFDRHGKYLLLNLDNHSIWLTHLGMSGRFVLGDSPADAPHAHAYFEFKGGKSLTYCDPRRFGFMDLFFESDKPQNRFLQKLGPDPYHQRIDADYLRRQTENRNTAIKTLLMNQSVIAGLGNIYCSEILWQARIHPGLPCSRLEPKQRQNLSRAIREVLRKAVKAGGSSFSDFSHPDGALGYFQHQWRVYHREGQPCPRCRNPVTRILQNNRAGFLCEYCTPPPASHR